MVEALSLDSVSNTGTNKKGGKDIMSHLKSKERLPLLRFRAGAVAVIAAHRMQRILKGAQKKMFIAEDIIPGIPASVVYTGECDQNNRNTSGNSLLAKCLCGI